MLKVKYVNWGKCKLSEYWLQFDSIYPMDEFFMLNEKWWMTRYSQYNATSNEFRIKAQQIIKK